MESKIRLMKEKDTCAIWQWFVQDGWSGFGWTSWRLFENSSNQRQWVAVNENDCPISYIALSEQGWGYFVAAYITAKAYRNRGIGWNLWKEIVGKMEKENLCVTSTASMIQKYADRSNLIHISPIELIRFKGRLTFLDTLKTLPKGLFNPEFKVYPIQDDRTIEKVIAYDRRAIADSKRDANRDQFLWIWLRKGRITCWDSAPKIMSLYAENSMGVVVGYGSISPSIGASKIAPLYADTPEIARTLMTELLKYYNSTVSPIRQVIINVPSAKKEFIHFLQDMGLVVSITLKQSFTKRVPNIDYDKIYCIAGQFCQLY